MKNKNSNSVEKKSEDKKDRKQSKLDHKKDNSRG